MLGTLNKTLLDAGNQNTHLSGRSINIQNSKLACVEA
jgi:hypothetical protein